MDYGEICAAVKRLRKKYGEPDPFALCDAMGVILLYRGFGEGPGATKGFYLECNRVSSITVNSDLPDMIQRIIVAHELGHAVLHRRRGVKAFHEVAMFDGTSAMEKEANLFAAELLLDDDEVLSTLNEDTTFFSAAAQLMVPAELLDFKFRVLKWKGYKLAPSPVEAGSTFLRRMPMPDRESF